MDANYVKSGCAVLVLYLQELLLQNIVTLAFQSTKRDIEVEKKHSWVPKKCN